MSIGVEFVLKASTGAFTRGVAAAENQLQGLKNTLKGFGGGQLAGALGIAGIIRGFSEILNSAQEARAELEKMGKPIDDATRSVASFADGIDGLKEGIGEVAIKSLSFFTRAGEGWGMLINRIKGVTREQEIQAEATAKAADEAEKNLAKSREANSPEKLAAAEKKLADARRDAAIAQADGEQKIAGLVEYQKKLQEEIAALGVNTVARKEKEIELLGVENKLIDEQAKQADAKLKRSREIAELQQKQAVASKNVENARAALRTEVLGDALPTIDELANRSGDDANKANQIRDLERRASEAIEFGSGYKLDEAAMFRTQAADLRASLAGKVRGSESGSLAADLSQALKTSENELATISKKLDGIFKAQP
jgi:hypothetical protein